MADSGSSGENMGAAFGALQALTGLFGSYESYASQRHALKIKQIENRINRRLAKAEFERKMTGLFQAQKDLDEQSMQQHQQREVEYRKRMGSMRVMQAERGMAGTSALDAQKDLTRSNLVAEQIMLGNMKKAERSMMYQREGIADARLAQELGFDMRDANISAMLETPAWVQALAGAPNHILDGMNTYYSFVGDTGRSGDVTG